MSRRGLQQQQPVPVQAGQLLPPVPLALQLRGRGRPLPLVQVALDRRRPGLGREPAVLGQDRPLGLGSLLLRRPPPLRPPLAAALALPPAEGLLRQIGGLRATDLVEVRLRLGREAADTSLGDRRAGTRRTRRTHLFQDRRVPSPALLPALLPGRPRGPDRVGPARRTSHSSSQGGRTGLGGGHRPGARRRLRRPTGQRLGGRPTVAAHDRASGSGTSVDRVCAIVSTDLIEDRLAVP